MHRAYRPIWFIAFAVAVVFALVWLSRMNAGIADANERIPWTHDLPAAQKQSTAENRPILLYFTASWCGPCQQMRRTTWADERVAAAVAKYIPVKIDIDDQSAIAHEYGVRSIPHVERLEPSGQHRVIADGAMSPDKFLKAIRE